MNNRTFPARSVLSMATAFASLVCLVALWPSQRVTAADSDSSTETPIVVADGLVAGKSMDQHAALLGDVDRTARLRALHSLLPYGDAAAHHLMRSLSHSDPAMRYIAAVGIGDASVATAKSSAEKLEQIARKDSSLAVQMAAAYALCKAGRLDEYLPLLVDRVGYPERGMSCSAAELIGKIGPAANKAVPALKQAFEDNKPGSPGDYHVGGAAKNALRKLKAID